MNTRIKRIQNYIRIFGGLAALLLVMLSDYHKNIPMLIALVSVYVAIGMVLRYMPLDSTADEMAHRHMVFLDVLMLSVAIGFRGGIRTDFYLGFFLIMGYATMFRSRKLLILLNLWIALCYFSAIWLISDITDHTINRIIIRMVMLAGASVMWHFYVGDLLRTESLREKALDLALKDELTGVYNRRMLTYISEEIDSHHRNVTVALLDIDNFKMVNDTFGHSAGDDVLKKLTGIILERLTADYTCIRYGGEEFLIIMEGCTEDGARHFVRSIMKEFSALRWSWIKDKKGLTFTSGLSSRRYNEPLRQLIDEADSALYEGKNNGKNIIVSYGQRVRRDIS